MSELHVEINIKDNRVNGKTDCSWDEIEVESFRNLIKSEKNLVTRVDDAFLLSCLRARKFDQKRALILLKNYFATKRKHPDLFYNFNSISTEKCLEAQIMGYLPGTDHLGRVLYIGRCDHWDPSHLHLKDTLSTNFLYLDFLMNSELVQVNGLVLIMDAAGFSLRQAIQINPGVAYRTLSAIFGSLPLRVKEVHLINANRIFCSVLPMIVPFLPHKLRSRFYFYSGVEKLHKYIPPAYLPCDFGGDLPPCDFTECNRQLNKHEEYFRENEKYLAFV